MKRRFLTAGVVAVALTVAGCGGTEGGRVGSNPGVPDAPSTPASELRVTVDPDGGAVRTWTLRCDPPGGTHPDPRAACTAIDEAFRGGDDPFAPTPRDMLCAEIFGGPQTATISGTWRGKPVNASYSRVNSCEIARWDRLKPVLEPGGSAPPA
ncbi:hypothetical protein C3Y87_10980 [Carbonactinospora thermoautotrophica]|uniref:SSI family serine proteinase inhibitor n=1 Tax=Carbonactinospora thermoautotrophica TaxID=1469144 RepID=UPI00226DCC80|nr:SSI family serine proteinase inhibitor [Carbonactinospora thermoautotrophica]MCX9191930.1 hypothetical protein [Carbonactinospora thermoautotrophica]